MNDPIRADELDTLFSPCFGRTGDSTAALAVSGGSDSTALMVLFADWLQQNGRPPDTFTVLTVDHGLRSESAAEAAGVACQAGQLGFRHATLPWEGAKRVSGLQAAARTARYELMFAHMRQHGLHLLLTGHTADDQAETLLMRLARGSGLDGLSAMAPISTMAARHSGFDPIWIARPLLDVPKARLRATLQHRGIDWVEDLTNLLLTFERSRLRAARGQLDALGLAPNRLALTARRLQRAREAIQQWVHDFCAPEGGNLHTDPCGFFRIDRGALLGIPAEVALRVLAATAAAAGGAAEPLSLAKLEGVAGKLRAGTTAGAWTLARVKITTMAESVLIEREPGRVPLPRISLEPGAAAMWDGRFWVRAGAHWAAPVEVYALGNEGVREIRKAHAAPAGVPASVLRTLPAFWRGGGLVAVPTLEFHVPGSAPEELSAVFAGLSWQAPALPRLDFIEEPETS